jgi:hypothetical protein
MIFRTNDPSWSRRLARCLRVLFLAGFIVLAGLPAAAQIATAPPAAETPRLHVPGHTPDAVALFDRQRGLLFTGDSFYEGPIWLYAPETDLEAFARSVDRLAALTPTQRKLHPAHNTPLADPRRLIDLREAVRGVRSGAATSVDAGSGQVEFRFEGFSILTSRKALRGTPRDPRQGGSGLDLPTDPRP